MKKCMILPTITLGLALLLVLSYIFPKQVIDTYKMNMDEEYAEELLALEEGSTISYTMNTGARPMKGIQPAISKQGGSFTDGILRYRVYLAQDDILVSDNAYALREGEDLQYVFLPFSDFERCQGDIRIDFLYESGQDGNSAPAFLINSYRKEGTSTAVNGELLEGGLKGYSVYTHDTYPLVYDLKILICLFLAASMTVNFSRKKKSGEGIHA